MIKELKKEMEIVLEKYESALAFSIIAPESKEYLKYEKEYFKLQDLVEKLNNV